MLKKYVNKIKKDSKFVCRPNHKMASPTKRSKRERSLFTKSVKEMKDDRKVCIEKGGDDKNVSKS